MRIPKWFLVVVAVCLAACTIAFVIRELRPEHDWLYMTDATPLTTFDRKTDTYCAPNGKAMDCVNLQNLELHRKGR